MGIDTSLGTYLGTYLPTILPTPIWPETMPGASLWLLPPHAHTLNQDLQSLIQQTSAHFGSSDLFIPHVTLTSGIPPQAYSSDPQAWLDSLHFSTASQVQVLFERLDSEDVFVRKLYIKCAKTDGLKQLAKVCRQQVPDCAQKAEAETWVNDTYNPHTSLL
jgi:2',3'-cyclic-nucleotide 3'-phosphodiesterase